MFSTNLNMAYKDFSFIHYPPSGFVQLAKLMRGDSLIGKISLNQDQSDNDRI